MFQTFLPDIAGHGTLLPFRRLFALLLTAVLAFAAAQAGAQNTAQGAITINGKKTEFKHAYAFPVLESVNIKTRVMLTDKPLSPKALTDQNARLLEIQKEQVQTLTFAFGEKEKFLSVSFKIEPLGGSAATSKLKAENTSLTDKVFKGRVFTEGQENFSKDVFAYDFRFDAGVFTATRY